jgi:FKBP-type peptidyl-prolyl cis-trans isomerase 2
MEIIGMRPGEKRRIRLLPDRAFGPLRPTEIQSFPAVKKLPKVMIMEPAEFSRLFQLEPEMNVEVPLTPYFNGRVVAFENTSPVVMALASEGNRQESFGTVGIGTAGDEIVIRMRATPGSDFALNGRAGRVTRSDAEEFTVDFNHPMAGKEIVLDIEIVSLFKAVQLRDSKLAWMENYEAGVQAGADLNKPIVVLLHAEWCDWCKKLMTESLQNPHIKMLRDDFVWVKIDSDKQPELAAKFDQKTFPMVVILDRKGNMAKRIEGYRDAAALKKELEEML